MICFSLLELFYFTKLLQCSYVSVVFELLVSEHRNGPLWATVKDVWESEMKDVLQYGLNGTGDLLKKKTKRIFMLIYSEH